MSTDPVRRMKRSPMPMRLEIVESIFPETVRQTLKKNVLKPHLRKQWVIPPSEDAAFVNAMEQVLDLYQKPLDTDVPVVNMDEQSVRLRDHIRAPQPAKSDQVERVDSEYKRNGTASIFLFTEALSGYRYVSVRERRTTEDWSQEIKVLLDEKYPDAKRVVLVCDNLNTHKLSSLYKVFDKEEANRLCARLEIVYTPKHGSWLNIAEIELSVLTRQCLCRRIPDIKTLQREAKAWEVRRNTEAKQVDWQFSTNDARIRLKRLYPQYYIGQNTRTRNRSDFRKLMTRFSKQPRRVL